MPQSEFRGGLGYEDSSAAVEPNRSWKVRDFCFQMNRVTVSPYGSVLNSELLLLLEACAKNIKSKVCSCVPCQQAKETWHTKSPIGTFTLSDAHFAHIHIDILDPLPPSEGNQYCLIIIDRFSRWSEVIPTLDMTAETITYALLHFRF
ncbi:transposon Tf2-11 polyprotein [Nephila pilipes]|uniref:Transposon Tf2-11 polyprotein n=1 Tax=Nephila pilipes TaxID=299642 RepID=A0A8X6Q1C6_NEPPI|nr:transposon Tf2-11 polyprotein [Nephila pilipes]